MKHPSARFRPIGPLALAGLLLSSVTGHAQTTPNAPAHPALTSIDPGELELFRSMLPDYLVLVAKGMGGGADSRETLYFSTSASPDLVRRAIATPEEYPTFMPALQRVEVLSRHERRAAFRFHVNAVVLDVTADANLHSVNDHRIDFTIDHSDFGPGGARWELFPNGTGGTIVGVSIWCDPSQASWSVRQVAAPSGAWASSSAGMTAGITLALGVRRRAEMLASGGAGPARPASVVRAVDAPRMPPAGPWLALTRETNVVLMRLGPEGVVEEITAAGAAGGRAPSELEARIMTPEHYSRGWTWTMNQQVLSHEGNVERYSMALGGVLPPAQGELQNTLDAEAHSVAVDGQTGAFAQEHHRWDFVPYEGGTYMLYTGGSDEAHFPYLQRQLTSREPWTALGMTAYWKVVVIRMAFYQL